MALRLPRSGMEPLLVVSSKRSFISTCRLQLQGELQSKKEVKRMYRGVVHGYGVILRNEGVKGLMRGIGCAVCFSIRSYKHGTLMRSAVRIPNHAERMSSRILRADTEIHGNSNVWRREPTISWYQYLFGRIFGNHWRRSWFTFLPRQNAFAIIFHIPTSRHAT